MDTHTVKRAFGGTGKQYKNGDSVDASKWPLRSQLESQGYIAPIPEAAIVANDPIGAAQSIETRPERKQRGGPR